MIGLIFTYGWFIICTPFPISKLDLESCDNQILSRCNPLDDEKFASQNSLTSILHESKYFCLSNQRVLISTSSETPTDYVRHPETCLGSKFLKILKFILAQLKICWVQLLIRLLNVLFCLKSEYGNTVCENMKLWRLWKFYQGNFSTI